MSWFKKISQGGWTAMPNNDDIQDALQTLEEFSERIESQPIIKPLGEISVDDIPDDLFGWLETESNSITMPNIHDNQGWDEVIQFLNEEVSSRDFTHIVNNYRNGVLSPIILHSTYGVLEGRGRINFANALGIPVHAVELTL